MNNILGGEYLNSDVILDYLIGGDDNSNDSNKDDSNDNNDSNNDSNDNNDNSNDNNDNNNDSNDNNDNNKDDSNDSNDNNKDDSNDSNKDDNNDSSNDINDSNKDDNNDSSNSNDNNKGDSKKKHIFKKNTNIDFDIFGNIKTDITINYDYEKLDDYTDFFYEDKILENILENTFLKKLPFSKQNNILYQSKVLDSVKNFVELKNSAYVILNKCFRNNSLKDKCYKGIFDLNIIPITNSKKKIYKKILESDDTDILDKRDVYFSLFSEELDKFNKYTFDYKIGNISYIDYEIKINKLFIPYENISNFGYNICPNHLISALRLADLDTKDWSMNNSLNNYCISLEDHSKDTVSTKNKCILTAEETSIVGFLVLDNIYSKFVDIFDDSMFKYINFKEIGKITNITKAKDCIITCKNHNLLVNQTIYIQDSNLPINGFYNNINIVSKDTFSLGINTCDINITGVLGVISTNVPLDINIAKVKNKNNKITIENSKENENNIFLFDDISLNKEQYLYILDKLIPSMGDKIKKKIKNINSIDDLIDINNFLIRNKLDLVYDDYKVILEEYNKKFSELSKISDISENKNKTDKEEIIFFLSDKILLSDEIKEVYGKFTKNKIDSNYFRINWINNQDDYGSFYLNYISKYIYEHLDLVKNKSKYETILKDYKNKLENVKKIIEEEKSSKDYFACNKYKFEVTNKDSLNKLEDVNYGEIAFVKDTNEIYIYKENVWEFVKINKTVIDLENLCLLNKDIKDITVKDLICEFENECVNRKLKRNQKNYEFYSLVVSRFSELLSIINTNDLKNEINSNYNLAKENILLLTYYKKK